VTSLYRNFSRWPAFLAAVLAAALPSPLHAAVGDPQLKTDHPWYPGELAISTFPRLFATQAVLYKRVTGRDVRTDEDKALASFLWRNAHYAHAEEGRQDCFAAGFDKAEWNRDYWTGLFAHGFGLCGTTHAQWTAEMNALLGHCRARAVGVSGHNSFEVFLTGGAYGPGKWALLDHDISTVVFAPDGSRLLSIAEISQDLANLTNPAFKPERQHGWPLSGLHEADARGVFDSFRVAEYLSGYAGPPPMIHLRDGETLARYFAPGLVDGNTFVFWGMNYNTADIPGLERNRTWVNQPDKLFNGRKGTGAKPGQARYGNAVYDYRPDFTTGGYKQAAVSESATHVTFEFRTPYVIAATPSAAVAGEKWGVYRPGATNGLVIRGKSGIKASLSTDNGVTFTDPAAITADPATLGRPLDLTDHVKGRNHYQLRLHASAAELAKADLRILTICQANPATFPQLHDGVNHITYEASGLAIAGTGPTKAAAEAHIVDGKLGSKSVTVELKTPRGEPAVHVYAAGWLASGNPPDAKAASSIEYSTDGGQTWQPVVKDWRIERRAPEPPDFWSQSFIWADLKLPSPTRQPIRVRFNNSAGKTFRKVEAYVAYEVSPSKASTAATFTWQDDTGGHSATTHIAGHRHTWQIPAGKNVRMKSVAIK